MKAEVICELTLKAEGFYEPTVEKAEVIYEPTLKAGGFMETNAQQPSGQLERVYHKGELEG